MKIKIQLICVASVFCLGGCATKVKLLDEVLSLHQPYRVIQHNFDTKYGPVYTPAVDPQASTVPVVEQSLEKDEAPVVMPVPNFYENLSDTTATEATPKESSPVAQTVASEG